MPFKSLVPGSESSRASGIGNSDFYGRMVNMMRAEDASAAAPVAAAAPASIRLGYRMSGSRAEDEEDLREIRRAATAPALAQAAVFRAAKLADIDSRLAKLKASAAKSGVVSKDKKRTAVTEQPLSPKTPAQLAKAAALKRDADIKDLADELRNDWYDNNSETATAPDYVYFIRMASEELSGKGRYRPEMRGCGRALPLLGSTRPY